MLANPNSLWKREEASVIVMDGPGLSGPSGIFVHHFLVFCDFIHGNFESSAHDESYDPVLSGCLRWDQFVEELSVVGWDQGGRTCEFHEHLLVV
jgi:hypothetical protein